MRILLRAAAMTAMVVFLASGIGARTARGQSYTWLANTTGTITTASNWVSGSAGAIVGTNNTMGNTQSLIPSGTAILAGSAVSTGTLTIDTNATVASGTTASTSFLPFSLINNGTLRIGTASQITLTNTNSPIVNAGVFEISGGGALRLYTPGATITNTNGLISVTSGTLLMDRSSYTINGGTMSIGPGGSQVTEVANTTFRLNNMNIANSGLITVTKGAAAISGARVLSYELAGTGTFANSGVVSVLFNAVSGSITANNTTSMTFSSGQTVTNTGTINISSLYSVTAGTAAVFVSGSSNFTNQGRINVTTSASSVDTAQLRWSTALGNSGVMSVDGPKSSIQLGGQAFTQTGATSSLGLVNGGRIVAGSVAITSGTLLGTGTVSAPATIGGIVAPGDAGIGTLSMGGNVTWNAGNNWQFELGTAAASLAAASTGSSTQDLLSINGTFAKGTGSTFTFDFLATGATGWYRLADWSASTTFVAGDFAATNLADGNTANFVVDGPTSALYVEVFAVVPEPGALALVGIGVAGAGWLRRLRGRRRTV